LAVSIDQVVNGDALEFVKRLPDSCVDLICTSPPFWKQRDYDADGQYGLEEYMHDYLDRMSDFFIEVKRVLKKRGTLWLNVGDCYNENSGGYFNNKNNDAPNIGKNRLKTSKYNKEYPRRSLLMIPYRLSIKMIDEGGWHCRNLIIWKKKIVQPTTAKNRFTIDFEPVFLFTQSPKYYFDMDKVKWIIEDNGDDIFSQAERSERRAVWDLSSDHSGKTGHIAPYPEDLAAIPILGGCPENGIVLDPFVGSGATIAAARSLGCRFLACNINEEYCKNAEKRVASIGK